MTWTGSAPGGGQSRPTPTAQPDLTRTTEGRALLAARESLCAFTLLTQPGYQSSRVHRVIAAHLEAVERGDIARLQVRCPPRVGKSVLCSRAFPAWVSGRRPDRNFVGATYDLDLAREVGYAVRATFQSPEFEAVFPACRLTGRVTAANRARFSAGGSYRAVGIRSALTGRGYHLGVVDDPIKDLEDADSPTMRRRNKRWWVAVFMRRMSPDGRVVLVTNRWHEDDLAGWLEHEHPGEWHVLSLPALYDGGEPCCSLGDWRKQVDESVWPEVWPTTLYHRVRSELDTEYGARVWTCQYQQRGVVGEGRVFKQAWLQLEHDGAPQIDQVVHYWDLKLKGSQTSGSYVCGLVWGRGRVGREERYYLLDCVRFRGGFAQSKQAVRALRQKWLDVARESQGRVAPVGAVYVEDAAAGPAVLEELRAELPDVLPDQARGSKEQRAQAVAPMFESGRIYLPPKGTPWLQAYREEMANFPDYPTTDQVDCTSGGLLKLKVGQARAVVLPSLVQEDVWDRT